MSCPIAVNQIFIIIKRKEIFWLSTVKLNIIKKHEIQEHFHHNLANNMRKYINKRSCFENVQSWLTFLLKTADLNYPW